jgi:hypothetical protein
MVPQSVDQLPRAIAGALVQLQARLASDGSSLKLCTSEADLDLSDKNKALQRAAEDLARQLDLSSPTNRSFE